MASGKKYQWRIQDLVAEECDLPSRCGSDLSAYERGVSRP